MRKFLADSNHLLSHDCALVLLDLSAAFDTVDHDILIEVLGSRFGIQNTARDWFQSFISSRSQMFVVDLNPSTTVNLPCGVPQGSVLGPKKFIAYTEDLAETLGAFPVTHHLYADDTQILHIAHLADIPSARTVLERCISAAHDWCASRRLQLNPAKTEYIWFGSAASHKKLAGTDTTLHVGTITIESTDVVRDLGVYMDKELNMQTHVAKLSSACFFHLRRLRQLRYAIPNATMRRLVSGLILSRLDYCNCVLAGLPRSTLAPLTRVLHAAARLAGNLQYRDSVTEALRSLHWLPIEQRITYKLCIFMYSAVHGRCPSYITELLVPISALHNRARLRSFTSGAYDVPRVRTQFGKRAFSVAAPAAWNRLPPMVRSAPTVDIFKRMLKAHLFSIAFTPPS